MANYGKDHISKLRNELASRYERLESALKNSPESVVGGRQSQLINSTDIRLLVGDFDSVLKEIKRLK